MKPDLLSVLFAGVTLAGLGLGARVAAWPLGRVELPEGTVGRASAASLAPLAAADSTGSVIVARDAFRVTRRPAPLAYDPLKNGQALAAAAPRPALALNGIVWDGGVSPTALVEGIPGSDGPRVLRPGDVAGGLRVKTIKPDRIVITGVDTTWTLTVREPWR